MARQQIVLNGIEFKFQKDAIEHFKNMLGRYQNGQTIADDDRDILLALLERHLNKNPHKVRIRTAKYIPAREFALSIACCAESDSRIFPKNW